MNNIAVLITCFNRIKTTLICLESFYQMNIPENYQLDVFLVDDKSPDQTGRIIKEKYPNVNVIEGTGTLYWNGGMRLAWQTAVKTRDYDFYLWLNDDTVLFPDAFGTIIKDYYQLKNDGFNSLVEGIFCDITTKETTYSGSKKGIGRLSPNGNPQICDSITGNMVLIPKLIYSNVGILDKHFSHGTGDTDYGLRTISSGFYCSVSSKYVGCCKLNSKIQWYSPDISLSRRWYLLFSKTGGNIIEYLYFVYKHKGIVGVMLTVFHTIARLLFPGYITK